MKKMIDWSTEELVKFLGSLEPETLARDCEYDTGEDSRYALNELVRRSLASNLGSQATDWLADKFDKRNKVLVRWLGEVTRNQFLFSYFQEREISSPAAHFVFSEPITGGKDQWQFLPVIPEERKEVRFYWERFHLPSGEEIDVQKGRNGNFFRVREDGRVDVFLRRGGLGIGNFWLWALVDPQKEETEAVVAAVDPLNNYEALSGFDSRYKPLLGRVMRAVGEALGK